MPRKPREPRKPGQPLRNIRHERYAHARAEGKTIEQAQGFAGLAVERRNAPEHSPNYPDMTRNDLKARIAELVATGIKASELTPEIPINGLLNEAMNSDNSAARVAANKALLDWLSRGLPQENIPDFSVVLQAIRATGDVELEKYVIRLPGLPEDKENQ